MLSVTFEPHYAECRAAIILSVTYNLHVTLIINGGTTLSTKGLYVTLSLKGLYVTLGLKGLYVTLSITI